MREDEIRSLYDTRYAQAYDQRFLTGPAWAKLGADFELEVLAELLGGDDPCWLDVACGTGWFLGRFPGVHRTGLDLSPAMAARAREAAPDATIVEGSYLDDHPEWDGAWDLVSCMWFAYAYVDSVAAVERVFANLARWTAPGGSLFVPVCDLVDLTGGTSVPYRNDDTWTFGGTLRVTGVVWSWTDHDHGKDHRDLVCPHLDHLVATLGRWFEQVEVVHYPPLHPGWGGRRALVARAKRAEPDVGPAVVITQRLEAYRPTGDEPEPTATEPVAPAADPAPEPVPALLADGANPAWLPAAAADPTPADRLAGVPATRRHGAWRAWWALPLPVRRGVRSSYHVIPPGVRRRLWAERR